MIFLSYRLLYTATGPRLENQIVSERHKPIKIKSFSLLKKVFSNIKVYLSCLEFTQSRKRMIIFKMESTREIKFSNMVMLHSSPLVASSVVSAFLAQWDLDQWKKGSVSYFLPPHLSPSSQKNQTSCRVTFFQRERSRHFIYCHNKNSSLQ